MGYFTPSPKLSICQGLAAARLAASNLQRRRHPSTRWSKLNVRLASMGARIFPARHPNAVSGGAAPIPSTSVCSGSGIGVAQVRPKCQVGDGGDGTPVASRAAFVAAPIRRVHRNADEVGQRHFVGAANHRDEHAVLAPRRNRCRFAGGWTILLPISGRRGAVFRKGQAVRANRKERDRVWTGNFFDARASGSKTKPATPPWRAAWSNCGAWRPPRLRAWWRPGSRRFSRAIYKFLEVLVMVTDRRRHFGDARQIRGVGNPSSAMRAFMRGDM